MTTYRAQHMTRPSDSGNRIEITWHPATGEVAIDEHVDSTSWVEREGYQSVPGIDAEEAAVLIDAYGDGGLTDAVSARTAEGTPVPTVLHDLLTECTRDAR